MSSDYPLTPRDPLSSVNKDPGQVKKKKKKKISKKDAGIHEVAKAQPKAKVTNPAVHQSRPKKLEREISYEDLAQNKDLEEQAAHIKEVAAQLFPDKVGEKPKQFIEAGQHARLPSSKKGRFRKKALAESAKIEVKQESHPDLSVDQKSIKPTKKKGRNRKKDVPAANPFMTPVDKDEGPAAAAPRFSTVSCSELELKAVIADVIESLENGSCCEIKVDDQTHSFVYKRDDSSTQTVRVLGKLGEGGYNQVSRAEADGQLIALRRPRGKQEADGDAKREVATYQAIWSSGLVENLVVPEQQNVFLEGSHTLTPLFNRGDLNGLVEKGGLDATAKREIAVGMSRGLSNLHQMNMVHNDFKPAQVLVEQDDEGNWSAHVSDFGKTQIFDEMDPDSFKVSSEGTPVFFGPETWPASKDDKLKGVEALQMGQAKDNFALGMSLFMLYVNPDPTQWAHGSFFPGTEALLRSKLEEAPDWIEEQIEQSSAPGDVKDVIRGLLQWDPNSRASAAQALQILQDIVVL